MASQVSQPSDAAAAEKQDVESPVAQPQRQSVPRSQRRGILGRVTIIPEIVNPYEYNNGTKWLMTVIVSMAACTSSFGSSIFYPALSEVAVALNTTSTVTNLSLAFYMLAMAFSPLWWSTFSEKLGRRNTYFLSFSIFVVFSVISAVSVNIAMLIVMRILSGAAAASVQAVGAGTVSDIWEPKERGRAMGVFYLGPLCGPGLAPIIGGALTQNLGWRSTLWFLAIFGGALLASIIFLLPETLKHKTPTETAEADARSTGQKIISGIFGPPKVLLLIRHPPVLVTVYLGAIAFGSLFILNISIQANFGKAPYNFDDTQVGLLYLAPTLGYAISSLLGGRWVDYIMVREAKKVGRYQEDGKLKYLPEDRMKENIWLAATLWPAALIWYGWAVDKHLQEFVPGRSASGVAVNNFLRNVFSCTAAIITQPLIDAMGTGWMCTMFGLLCWVSANAVIFALVTQHKKWREVMDRKLNQKK